MTRFIRPLIMTSIIALVLVSFSSGIFAEETSKPVVAILFVNNAKTTYDADLGEKITDRIKDKLERKFDLRQGKTYMEKLNKIGITDLTTAERSDVADVLQNEGIDYVVYVELQPVIVKSWESFFNIGTAATVTVPLKIIDVANNKYLYNGKFVEQADNSSMFGGVGTKAGAVSALNKVLDKMSDVLKDKIPLMVMTKASLAKQEREAQ